MFHNFWKIILTLQDGAYIFITIVLLLFWFISIINLLFSKTIKVNSIDTKIPTNLEDKISVLIPARNEESKIGFLLESLSMQTYKNIEIHILDDNSDDNTFSVIQEYQNKFANIKVYKGQKLPNSWTGKNWACYQLSQKATSEILLFVDADIILNQSAIELLMNRFKENDVGLLSVFPTQIMKTFGEFLIVPLMNYILLSMLPLTLVLKSNRKSLLAANGQLMLWKKSTYQKIGGHFSVKDQVVEDIELAKKIKQNKEKVLTLLGGNYIFCRMYNSFFESINGFSKNFYRGFQLPSILFLLIFFIISFINLSPFFTFSYFDYSRLLILFLLIVSTRINISILSNQNLIVNLLLHPIQFLLLFYLSFLSVFRTKLGRNIWKGRKV